jgi:hypothetical protein
VGVGVGTCWRSVNVNFSRILTTTTACGVIKTHPFSGIIKTLMLYILAWISLMLPSRERAELIIEHPMHELVALLP